MPHDESIPAAALRLATRSSPLALVQVRLVEDALGPTVSVETVALSTSGDLRADVPIHSIGGRGVFVKEVDDAVLAGRADAAVHSAKDLPGVLTEGLVVGAYLPRADPRDALVGARLAELPAGGVVASGSVRRRAQLAWLRPDIRFVELRGNVGTRLRKLPRGGAMVLAFAGLQRLGMDAVVAEVLSTTDMLPQVGQGAVAVCCRHDDERIRRLLGTVDDETTRLEVESERSWLAAVGGGCDAPVAAFAKRQPSGMIRLEAMVASLDGHSLVRSALEGRQPDRLGADLAADLLHRCGGASVLERSGFAS